MAGTTGEGSIKNSRNTQLGKDRNGKNAWVVVERGNAESEVTLTLTIAESDLESVLGGFPVDIAVPAVQQYNNDAIIVDSGQPLDHKRREQEEAAYARFRATLPPSVASDIIDRDLNYNEAVGAALGDGRMTREDLIGLPTNDVIEFIGSLHGEREDRTFALETLVNDAAPLELRKLYETFEFDDKEQALGGAADATYDLFPDSDYSEFAPKMLEYMREVGESLRRDRLDSAADTRELVEAAPEESAGKATGFMRFLRRR